MAALERDVGRGSATFVGLSQADVVLFSQQQPGQYILIMIIITYGGLPEIDFIGVGSYRQCLE
ncbi:hypothetical protein HSX37_10100|uniref:hypothetical protein n=1 Tax=Dendrosporobacter quercicolus TaxID=146817 RepID=UPI000B8519B6|nr:hypothetical protein [Dendrosporobacter quercicolus]NSL48381.1 hypothetical protein [Dendrosporobacter quercicolus DSM 1736]